METEQLYTRLSYYPPKMGSGVGIHTEHAAPTDAVRRGGTDVPDAYDGLPAVELLVATWIDQSVVRAAIETLTGRKMLDRMLEVRRVDGERFPTAEYERLGLEQRRQVHEHIRQLASPRG